MLQSSIGTATTHCNSDFAYGYIDTPHGDIEDHDKEIAITPHDAETYNTVLHP